MLFHVYIKGERGTAQKRNNKENFFLSRKCNSIEKFDTVRNNSEYLSRTGISQKGIEKKHLTFPGLVQNSNFTNRNSRENI